MRRPDDFLLVSKAAVERLEKSSSGFRQFLARFGVAGGPVRRFPNGAIEINHTKTTAPGHHPLESYARDNPACRLEGAAVFRTLGPFQPERFYSIQYPFDYQERLKSEASFWNGRSTMRAPTPGEFELADLSVAVVFRGRVGKGVRRAFVDAVAAWGRAAVERGAFHDGPIRLASPGVTFVGTRAQFRIDASRSGQDTLNWLSLVMLDFGYEAHPISSVNFAHSDAELDAMFGPPSAAPILVPFPATPLASELPAEGEAAGMYVPLGARPHGSLHSKSFRVLELPVNEWDSFVSTVYFARNPRSEERRRFVALVRAWLHLGIFGGLGGGRTHWAEDVKFDEATDSAIIEADMGQADPDIAQRILIWALEGFETQDGAPIDALVFGTLEQ